MGLNGALNALFFLVLLIFTIGLNLVLTINNDVYTQVVNTMNTTGFLPGNALLTSINNFRSIMLTSTQFLMWLLISLGILSSFINSNDFKDYLLGAICCVIMSAVVLAIGTTIWNGYIVSGGTLLDFSNMNNGLLAVVANWQTIVAANLFACLASFVWAKKGPGSDVRSGGNFYYPGV